MYITSIYGNIYIYMRLIEISHSASYFWKNDPYIHIPKAIPVGFDRKGDYFGGRSLVEERNNVATIKPTGKAWDAMMPWGWFLFASPLW